MGKNEMKMHCVRKHPILCIYNSYLYVFFGRQINGIYYNSIKELI